MSSDQILNRLIELTSLEKFKGSSEKTVKLFEDVHQKIRTQHHVKIVTIAGTNGKGHVAFGLESALVSTGINVARWTSPHLYSVCERIGYNGKYIEESTLLDLINRNEDLAREMQFSFYEFLFYLFSQYLLQINTGKLEIIILEVGLGGRLDTTNFFDADLTALTSIGLDHTEILGNSLKEILLEKVEIARSGKVHFSLLQREYLKNLERVRVTEIGGIYHPVEFGSDYFSANQNLIACLYESLTANQMKNDVQLFFGPGRSEEFQFKGNDVIMNSTHNLDGFRAYLECLRLKNEKFEYCLIAFAQRDLKELNQILSLIKKYPCVNSKIVISSFDHPRALCAKDAQKISLDNDIPFVNYSEFLATIKSKKRILVTGSNYFLTEVHRIFEAS